MILTSLTAKRPPDIMNKMLLLTHGLFLHVIFPTIQKSKLQDKSV